MKAALFINPFLNHTPLTVLALSESFSLKIFCPPFTLSLLFQRIRIRPFRKAPYTSLDFSLFIFLIVSFVIYKLRLITHDQYLFLFRFGFHVYCRFQPPPQVISFYQDYVSDIVNTKYKRSFRICELIINSKPSDPNYNSTKLAIAESSFVVLPHCSLLHLLTTSSPPSVITTYGGNKVELTSRPSRSFIFLHKKDPVIRFTQNKLKFCARANTYRKGADTFLRSLLIFDKLLQDSTFSTCIEVCICGTIQEKYIRILYTNVLSKLSLNSRISLSCHQYNSDQFSALLDSSALFIMPSRQESSSLAALEALWHATPSILSPECGIGQFINGRHGTLLTVHDPEHLAHSVYSYCCNIDLLKLIHDNLIFDAKLFSWQAYFSTYSSIATVNLPVNR